MKYIFFTIVIFLCCGFVFGQTSATVPQTIGFPIPRSTPIAEISLPGRDSLIQYETERQNKIDNETSLKQIEYFYRHPGGTELKNLQIDSILYEKYKDVLNSEKAGIIRLVSEIDCDLNNKIPVAKDDCLKYQVPGSGSAYSFRFQTYRVKHLADLSFKDNYFYSDGKYTQTVIANLGSKSFESLTLESQGVKELAEFIPEKDIDLVAKQADKIEKGVIVNKILFTNKTAVELNSIYILRSIAFNAKNLVTFKNLTYNEFDYDKRRDVIIAFRVVEKNDDGSIVLLWKELRNEKAPKLNF
jgi:hypothetical protein